MKSKEKKERLCKQHSRLLELVYHFGKGIMFRQHILRYMDFDGIHEIDVSKSLLELKTNEIIDFQDMFGARIIVLKKFAICFLLEKQYESVASIRFTMGKAKQSAFLNQIVIRNISLFKKKKKLLLQENKEYFLKDLIKHYQEKSTYFSKDKESYLYLERQIKNVEGHTEKIAIEEVERLKVAKENARSFNRYSYDQKIPYMFSLNSMQARNMYLGLKRIVDGEIRQYVDILDVNGGMTANKFVKKVNDTADHMDLLFTRKITFVYVLFVQSEERKKVFMKYEKQINKAIYEHCGRDIIWEVVNLDLEKTLFKNQKILLSV